jgi:hypothetical protein
MLEARQSAHVEHPDDTQSDLATRWHYSRHGLCTVATADPDCERRSPATTVSENQVPMGLTPGKHPIR